MSIAPTILTCFLCSFAQAGAPGKPSADVAPKPVAGAGSAEGVFRKEYPAALRRMEAYFEELTASGTLRITKFPVDRPRTESTYKFFYQFSGGASKWEQVPIQVAPQDGTPINSVWCRNPEKYVLKLERPPGGDRFAVREVLPKSLPRSESVDGTIYRHLRAPYAVNGFLLSEIMAAPSFSVQSVEYVEEGGERLVHVKYDFSPGPKHMLRGGELWLMPDRGWAIRKCRSDYYVQDHPTTPAGMLCRVDYGAFEDGVAIPKRVAAEQKLGKFRIEEEFVYDKFAHGASPPGEFTLAHYGLAETFSRSPTVKSNWHMGWFLVLNGTFIVILLLTILWRRRARATESTGG